MRSSWPKPRNAVMTILIANGVAFMLDLVSQNASGDFWIRTFGLSLYGVTTGKVWQLVTYMFCHGNGWHLLYNMLLLYMFGTPLESTLGTKRFVTLYGASGIVGGLAYLVLGLIDPVHRMIPLIGASGGCFGLVVAAMIFFPTMQIIFIFVPMSVRVFGFIMLAINFIPLLGPGGRDNFGGQVCHMAGALAGVAICYGWGALPKAGRGLGLAGRVRQRVSNGAWERRLRREAEEAAAVDEILAKVSRTGMHSLSRRERSLLARATKRQNQRERELGRVDRL